MTAARQGPVVFLLDPAVAAQTPVHMVLVRGMRGKKERSEKQQQLPRANCCENCGKRWDGARNRARWMEEFVT